MIELTAADSANELSEGQAVVRCVAVVSKDVHDTIPLYWLRFNDNEMPAHEDLQKALTAVLTDPLQEDLWLTLPAGRVEWIKIWADKGFRFCLEKQFAPGVTDNLAHTVEEALKLKGLPNSIKVASGHAYLFRADAFSSADDLLAAGCYKFFHPISERCAVHDLKQLVNNLELSGNKCNSHESEMNVKSGSASASYPLRDPDEAALGTMPDIAEERGSDQRLLGFPAVHLAQSLAAEIISLNLTDNELLKLSKDRVLALSLEEMKAIKKHFSNAEFKSERSKRGLPAAPTDVELEIIAQTWSEHCKHKIFNAKIDYIDHTAPPGKQKLTVKSLYKSYIQDATQQLMKSRPDLLSVFKDNSGVIKWDEHNAICFKVETHNSPSALEPYGGALTGILGVNRDIIGTGLGAWPIFNTDIFCFAFPSADLPQRPKLLPAKAIIDGVRRGVQDGGNKSGIPTVNGAIFFDPAYRAKPLVFCGTGGILPLVVKGDNVEQTHRAAPTGVGSKSEKLSTDTTVKTKSPEHSARECATGSTPKGLSTGVTDCLKIKPLEQVAEIQNRLGYEKYTRPGDTIVMVGGRVGKDGVHGATFSSEALHEESPVSAVQIGDPFTQKRVMDFVVAARDAGLITGITDNGAGGLSSSVGEMAQFTGGATIELDNVPTKYPGLTDWEIVVSESQERMTIATDDFAALQELAQKYNVEVSDIGKFNAGGYFTVTRSGKPVASLALAFLHDGCPAMELEAEWKPSQLQSVYSAMPDDLNACLLKLLAHPNICSRETVIRRYDHEVQGTSVIKPLMGAKQIGPCDAAVIIPVYGGAAGLAISNGLSPRLSKYDTYLMAVCAVDEAVRNAVCVGADPATLALLDNFCWPDPIVSDTNRDGKHKLGQLVRACMGLRDAVLAYAAPLISGKDSMKNDFDDGVIRISIPPTLLISAIGRVPDAGKSVSMEFKQAGDLIYLLKAGDIGLAASHYEEIMSWQSESLPALHLKQAAQLYARLHEAIASELVQSAHDLAEGGLAVALAECAIGGGLGAQVSLKPLLQLLPDSSASLVTAEQVVRSTPQEHKSIGTAMPTDNAPPPERKNSSAAMLTDNAPPPERKNSSAAVPPDKSAPQERVDTLLFGEGPAHIIVSIDPVNQKQFETLFAGLTCLPIGRVTSDPFLQISTISLPAGHAAAASRFIIDLPISALVAAWKTELPFD